VESGKIGEERPATTRAMRNLVGRMCDLCTTVAPVPDMGGPTTDGEAVATLVADMGSFQRDTDIDALPTLRGEVALCERSSSRGRFRRSAC
jgi:hypothetical protein